MKRIYKYTVPMGGWATYDLPLQTVVLAAREQEGTMVLYAEVPQGLPANGRLRVHGVVTGDIAPQGARYIDTVMLDGGKYVIHIYVEWVLE